MFDPRTLWSLPKHQARLVHEFIFHPAAYIHPQRLEAVWPGPQSHRPTNPDQDTALSAAILAAFDLSDKVELDLHVPLHQVALLGTADLARLAHRCEVLALAPDLRRIILRREIEALQPCLSPEDWDLVFAADVAVPQGAEAPVWPNAGELLQAFGVLGWQVLEAAFVRLPDSVSRRACLKLPVSQPLDAHRTPWALGLVESAWHMSQRTAEPAEVAT